MFGMTPDILIKGSKKPNMYHGKYQYKRKCRRCYSKSGFLLEIILIFDSFNLVYLALSIITIFLVVLSRYIGVSIPVVILSRFKNFEETTEK